MSIRTEAKAWKYINKYRKKERERIDENIELESWENHFVDLLKGTKRKAVLDIEEKKEEEVQDITKEELVRRLKNSPSVREVREVYRNKWRLLSRSTCIFILSK